MPAKHIINTILQEQDSDYFRDSIYFEPEGNITGQVHISCSMLISPTMGDKICGDILQLIQNKLSQHRENLETLFKEIISSLNHIFKNNYPELSKQHTHIVVGVNFHDTLYVTANGHGSAYLFRKTRAIDISSDIKDADNPDIFSSFSMGKIRPEDLAIFTSERLPLRLQLADLSNFHINISPKKLVKNIKKLAGNQTVNMILDNYRKSSSISLPSINIKRFFRSLSINKKHLATATSAPVITHTPQTDPFMEPATTPKGRQLLSILHKQIKGLRDTLRLKKHTSSHTDHHKQGLKLPQLDRKKKLLLTTFFTFIFLIIAITFVYQKTYLKTQQLGSSFAKIVNIRKSAETRKLFDKAGAAKQLEFALTQITDIKHKGYNAKQANIEQNKIKFLLDDIYNVIHVQKPKLITDISNYNSAVTSLGIITLADQLFTYDQHHLYKIILDKVETYPITDKDEQITLAQSFADNNSIIFFTNKNRLLTYKDGEVVEQHTPESTWHHPDSIAEYQDSDNIYFLDRINNEIWSYSASQGQYRAPQRKNTAKLDLGKAISLAIDGHIYVLTSDNNVLKTYGGKSQNWSFRGLPKQLGAPTKLITSQAHDFIHILYPESKSIVTVSKTGNFISRHIFDNLKDIIDFRLSEELATIEVITANGKVYQTPYIST